METLSYRHTAARAAGSKPMAIVGVVTSGNLEVMVERCLPNLECQVDIATSAETYADKLGLKGKISPADSLAL